MKYNYCYFLSKVSVLHMRISMGKVIWKVPHGSVSVFPCDRDCK